MSVGILNARVVTLAGLGATGSSLVPKSGAGPAKDADPWLGVSACASVLIETGRISWVKEGTAGAEALRQAKPDTLIDARGRVLLPGFVDCHTHSCWAGNRLDEWLYQRRGRTYLDVLASGGGIMSTVRAVRAASQSELAESLQIRLMGMLAEGSTTIEVKSGYGLSTGHELKMLLAIRDAAAVFPGTVVPTALLGHAIDPEFPGGAEVFVQHTIRETLPAVSREFPGIAVDAYCEKGAWSVEQCASLFEAARSLGHPVRVHADQFNSLGMIRQAIRLGAISVDHLEASTTDDLAVLAQSGLFGVVLPICGLHVDDRYANARRLLDASSSAQLAIATNNNPGSAPSGSMPLAIGLAVRKCGLWPSEALAAATINPACLLGFKDRGQIVPGMRADLVLLRHSDERLLAYQLGLPHVDAVICGGKIVPSAVPAY